MSPATLAANRANAQLSTGPLSAEGKRRSSANAFRHGLTSRTVVMPGEDHAAYEKFSRNMIESLRARTALELQFAQTIADNSWRLNRLKAIEDAMLSLAASQPVPGYEDAQDEDPLLHHALAQGLAFQQNSRAFANLSIYEQRLHRSTKLALEQLEQAQAKRKAENQTRPAALRKQPNGFVFSTPKTAAAAASGHPSDDRPLPPPPADTHARGTQRSAYGN